MSALHLTTLPRLLAIVALTMATLLVLASDTSAQETGTPVGEGSITVHGKWTLTVRENGRIVRQKIFDNDLRVAGERILMRLLSRTNTIGPYRIDLSDPRGAARHPCSDSGGDDVPCVIIEEQLDPNNFEDPSNVFATLTISTTDSRSVVLSGEATAALEGRIGRVMAWLWECREEAAQGCDTEETSGDLARMSQFTMRDLPDDERVSVSPGQQIQVEVEYTFGS